MLESTKQKSKPVVIRRGKQSMLIVDGDDPESEDNFEIEFMLSLTPTQRYTMMSRLVRQGKRMIKNNDIKKTPVLVTRT